MQLLVIVSLFFALCWAVNLAFWWFRFRLLAQYDGGKEEVAEEELPISIIICARNEAENLRRNLPLFLEQDYSNYELIVVDDNSSDETSSVVLDFQEKYSNLQLLKLEGETPPGKKAALKQGIINARFDWLILSDADCRPAGPHWLRRLQSPFHTGTLLVLGFGPYQRGEGFLNRFIRFEAFYTAIQYLSFTLAGDPYMGVGRNLAYHRSMFHRADQFSRHEHLISGDDDLLVNEVADARHTSIIIAPEAHVHSAPETSWRVYYHQKRRHLSVGSHYRWNHKLALGALALSHVGTHTSYFLAIVLASSWWPFLTAMYLVRIGVILRVSSGISRQLGERDLLPLLPLLDLTLVVYYFVLAPSLLTGSRLQQWK